MKKKNKKPKQLMIESVLEDLQNDMGEPSIQKNQTHSKSSSALASAILNANSEEGDLYESTTIESKTNVEAPVGLNLSESEKKSILKSKTLHTDDDKTALVDEKKPQPVPILAKNSSAEELPKTTVGAPVEKTFVVGEKASIPKSVPTSAPQVATRPNLQTESKQSYSMPRPVGYEAQFMQAENLKIAQQRIVELERDLEKLRKENEILASAGEMARQKTEEMLSRIHSLDRQKSDLKETSSSELQIFRDGLAVKESEIHRLRTKVEELESRLANDLRKIRVRERELENRLELSKMEKMALLKSKDETILELKRKTENLEIELENHQKRESELAQKIEANQEQFARTVRALRIALTNLEVNENTSSITIAPFKKAE